MTEESNSSVALTIFLSTIAALAASLFVLKLIRTRREHSQEENLSVVADENFRRFSNPSTDAPTEDMYDLGKLKFNYEGFGQSIKKMQQERKSTRSSFRREEYA